MSPPVGRAAPRASCRQGHIAVLGSLAARTCTCMRSLSISPTCRFKPSCRRAERIDGPQVSVDVRLADRPHQPLHLLDREYVRQSFPFENVKTLQDLPVARFRASIEELDAAVRQSERGGSELLDVLEKQQILPELLLGEAIRRCLEVIRQLPDGAQISLLSACTQTGQLQILLHSLTQHRGRRRLGCLGCPTAGWLGRLGRTQVTGLRRHGSRGHETFLSQRELITRLCESVAPDRVCQPAARSGDHSRNRCVSNQPAAQRLT